MDRTRQALYLLCEAIRVTRRQIAGHTRATAVAIGSHSCDLSRDGRSWIDDTDTVARRSPYPIGNERIVCAAEHDRVGPPAHDICRVSVDQAIDVVTVFDRRCKPRASPGHDGHVAGMPVDN